MIRDRALESKVTFSEELTEEEKEDIIKQKEGFKRILKMLKTNFPNKSEEELEKLAIEIYLESVVHVAKEEDKRFFAIQTLRKGARYIQGYLKNYRVEYDLQEDTYPLVLTVKVYY